MPGSAEPVRVLVADDHPLYRTSVTRAVEAHPGLELAGEAGDGRSALAALRELRPDVAVVDLRMPGLDGNQIVEAVAAEALPTRVLLLSGHLHAESAYIAVQSGAAGVLSKVADATALTDAILAVARGETVLAEEAQAAVVAQIRMRAVNDKPPISPREREVLALVAEGGSVASIAADLHLSQSTVKTHLENLYRKLGVSDRAAAVAEAMRRGILH